MNRLKPWVIGVDLGGTKIRLGLISPDNTITATRLMATNAHEGIDAVTERIGAAVHELQESLPARCHVAAVGICSPGPVDHAAGLLIDPPNLQGLHHAPLRQKLSDRLQLPVVLEHDAKAAGLGDYHYGAGRGAHSMVYIVIGTGVGAALILDGEVYRGAHNSAGEIGHATIDRRGDLCSCGSHGCVETFLSGPWLGRRYERAAGQPADALPLVSGNDVARLAAEGDPIALQVFEDAGDALGATVATLAMMLDVDLYVIGGSVAKAGDLLLEPARRGAPRYSHHSVGERVRIVQTALGDDGPLLGCAWLARQA
jgi:glucokinase